MLFFQSINVLLHNLFCSPLLTVSCIEHEIKTAKIGLCETGCENLIPYIAMNFVTSILTAIIKIMPLYIVKLR